MARGADRPFWTLASATGLKTAFLTPISAFLLARGAPLELREYGSSLAGRRGLRHDERARRGVIRGGRQLHSPETVKTVAEIIPWLQEAVAHFYSGSSYARSLSPKLREHAKQRLFQPPKVGAQVIWHCGAPHAAPPGMDELFAFVCHRCGNRERSDEWPSITPRPISPSSFRRSPTARLT
jgi:hypothetical protein